MENQRPNEKFITDWDSFYKHLERTFELRHIFCHEKADISVVDYNEIGNCLEATANLIEATNYLMYQKLLKERDDYTQAELTEMSIEKFKVENSKLKKIEEGALNYLFFSGFLNF